MMLIEETFMRFVNSIWDTAISFSMEFNMWNPHFDENVRNIHCPHEKNIYDYLVRSRSGQVIWLGFKFHVKKLQNDQKFKNSITDSLHQGR